MVDQTSAGWRVVLVSPSREARIPGAADPRTGGQKVDEDVSDRIESLEYEDDERDFDVLRLRVDNHDLRFFESPGFVKGNVVRFTFGYPGRVFGPREAIVDGFRGFRTLDVTCTERTVLTNRALCGSEAGCLYENKTRLQVILDLVRAGEIEGVTRVDLGGTVLRPSGTRDVEQIGEFKKTRASEILGKEKPATYVRARQTAWQFLLTLVEPIGFRAWVEADVLHVHPQLVENVPVRMWQWYYGDGTLIDFTIDEARTLSRPSKVVVAGRDPIARTNHRAEGSDATTERPVLGPQSDLLIRRQERTGPSPGALATERSVLGGSKVFPSPDPDPAVAKNEADAHYRASEMLSASATARIVGDPLLKAKTVVEIQGISKLFSGGWYVTKHVHRLDASGGYVGTLSLTQNAQVRYPRVTSVPFVGKLAAVNDQPVPEDPRQTIVTRSETTGGVTADRKVQVPRTEVPPS